MDDAHIREVEVVDSMISQEPTSTVMQVIIAQSGLGPWSVCSSQSGFPEIQAAWPVYKDLNLDLAVRGWEKEGGVCAVSPLRTSNNHNLAILIISKVFSSKPQVETESPMTDSLMSSEFLGKLGSVHTRGST